MPKRLKSLGHIKISSPFIDELQRFVCYELVNMKDWNATVVSGGMIGINRWQFEMKQTPEMTDKPIEPKELELAWVIAFDGRYIECISNMPVIHIRQGLSINMGQGRIELEGRVNK